MRRILTTVAAPVLALLLVGLLVFGVLQTSDDSSLDQAVARGERPAAHDAALQLLDGGGARRLADYRGGWLVMNFFASWCGPCEAEAPLLNRLQRRLAGRGTVVGVAWNDLSEDAQAFVREYDVRYPVLRDVDRSFGDAYDVKGVPETFVIDPRGRVVALNRSELTADWIASAVDPLIASGAARG